MLCVGDAEVFEARFPVVYNAVFNESLFERWFAASPTSGNDPATWRLKPSAEISAKLRKEGITHVYVNWSWIRTYRSPGNYDYSKFVTADRFEQLAATGVLGQPTNWGAISLHGMSDKAAMKVLSRLPFPQRTSTSGVIEVTDAFDALTGRGIEDAERSRPVTARQKRRRGPARVADQRPDFPGALTRQRFPGAYSASHGCFSTSRSVA